MLVNLIIGQCYNKFQNQKKKKKVEMIRYVIRSGKCVEDIGKIFECGNCLIEVLWNEWNFIQNNEIYKLYINVWYDIGVGV